MAAKRESTSEIKDQVPSAPADSAGPSNGQLAAQVPLGGFFALSTVTMDSAPSINERAAALLAELESGVFEPPTSAEGPKSAVA